MIDDTIKENAERLIKYITQTIEADNVLYDNFDDISDYTDDDFILDEIIRFFKYREHDITVSEMLDVLQYIDDNHSYDTFDCFDDVLSYIHSQIYHIEDKTKRFFDVF